jgi:beta-glucanase (GH16 family)
MRRFHFIFTVAICIMPLSARPAPAQTCPQLPPLTSMKLTFSDEFKTPALDTAKWTAIAQGGARAINDEQQAYVPGNVSILPGGGARLQATTTPFGGQPYTSGEIVTRGHFAQTYGYFEAKLKFPDGNGLWPAFWLLPNDGSWPPEIAVAEYIYAPWGKHDSSNRSFFGRGVAWPVGATPWRPVDSSAHSSNSEVYTTDNYKNMAAYPPVYGDWGTDYHVYGMAWYPGMVAFYVDDKQTLCWVENSDTKGSVPKQPMFLVANLAVSAPKGWPGTVDAATPFPANLDIAYVRAYQFADAPVTPLDPVAVTNFTISADKPRPGDNVTVSADIVIGDNVLPRPASTNFSIFNYDATHQIDSVDFPGPMSYAANTTYHLTTRYTIPPALPPGIYTIKTCVFWNGGQSRGQCLAPNQAPPLTIAAATPINGTCGASSGAVLNKVPSSNLCSTGAASAVSLTRPWSWTCTGTNDGTTASCSTASRQ